VVSRQGSLPIWRFGAFEVEGRTGELRRNGIAIKLQEQPSRLLLFLLEHGGEIITREDLRQELWPADTFLDFDHALNSRVMKLREALGDSSDNPVYIQTIPRKGYRFVAPVHTVRQLTPAQIAQTTDSDLSLDGLEGETAIAGAARQGYPETSVTTPDGRHETDSLTTGEPRTRSPAHPSRGRQVALILSVLLFIIGLPVVMNWGSLRNSILQRSSPVRIHSLAVLPLENLSGDLEQEYFADGMTAELITELAKISSIRVISRTSVMQYKRVRKPLAQIARELDVDAVVEGEVLRSHNRVRITAKLIDTAKDRHIWAETYDQDLRDVVSLQGDVVRSIANAIRARVTPDEVGRLTAGRRVKPESYETYLKGRYFLDKRTTEGFYKAVEYFQQAIREDPRYAEAYAGLAKTYDLLGTYELLPPKESFPKAREAANNALHLDGALSEAYAARGLASSMYERDWNAAEQDFQHAFMLNSNDATAHHWYAEHLINVGQAERAVAELERARKIDPLSLPINGTLGRVYRDAGRYDESIEQCQKTLGLDPDFAQGHWCLGLSNLAEKHFAEALAEMQRANALGTTPIYACGLGYAYAAAGNKLKARAMIEELKGESQTTYVPAYFIAAIYGALGEKDQAFAWLQRAYDERDPQITYLLLDPFMDPLRSDARFNDLVRKVGFPQ
jgi:TolB-like protein/DNA-binding winged helix-turn-helix (wHTH) protein/Tfp pilus assembly protein PilF